MTPGEEPIDEASLVGHLRRTVDAIGLDLEEIAAPTSRYVRVGDVRFHYLDWGGSGPPLLFLHGYGLNAHTWDAVALGLHRSNRCLALDQRGHGATDWGRRNDYTILARTVDAVAVLDEIGVGDVVVVGHSMGALVGLSVAARLGRRVNALVVVDASPFGSLAKSVGARFRERSFDSIEEALELVRRVNPARDPQILRQNLIFNLRRLENGRWAWRYDQSHEMLRPEDPDDRKRALLALVHEVISPTLVVRGERSAVVTADAANELVAVLVNARAVEIEHSGHNVQGDNPRRLVEVISAFLDQVGYR